MSNIITHHELGHILRLIAVLNKDDTTGAPQYDVTVSDQNGDELATIRYHDGGEYGLVLA
jgi:hypothetical protein